MKTKAFLIIWILVSLFACGNSTQPQSEMVKDKVILPFIVSSDYTPIWIDKADDEYKNIPQIPNFVFTDQTGKKISNLSFEDKIYVADFFFTSCKSICPKLSNNMKLIQDEFIDDRDVLLLSHSVTPWIDNVSVLKKYANEYGAISGKWFLVTGDEQKIYDIARKSYYADEKFGFNDDEDNFLHTDKFVLVDKQGRVRGVYSGIVDEDVDRLIEDIKILKLE